MNVTVLLCAIVLVLLAADWRQTIVIIRNPDRWREINPLLGEHPGAGRANIYFASCFIAVVAGAYFLPTAAALVAGGFVAGMEFTTVSTNLRKGIPL